MASAILLNAPPKFGAVTGILILIVEPPSMLGIVPEIKLLVMLNDGMQVALPEVMVQLGKPLITKIGFKTSSKATSIAIELVALLVISIIQSKVWLTKTEENSGNVCTTKSIQGAKYVVTVASLLEVFGSTNDPICSNVTLFMAGTALIEHSGLQSTMAKKVTELCAGSIQLSASKISQNRSSLPSSVSLS